MGRSIDEVIGRLPKERRNRIAKKAASMAKEMVTYADSLSMLRRAMTKTQSELGDDLGLPQNAVSQLEGRPDLLLSTLRRYVNALGADLDLVVRLKDGSKIVLAGFPAARAPSARKVATRKRPVKGA